VLIRQIYRISYVTYLADAAAYQRAFIYALAHGTRPKLAASKLSVVNVQRVDERRIKVTFQYQPTTAALPSTVAEIALAIAVGRADNTTESMEVEEDVAAEVLSMGSDSPLPSDDADSTTKEMLSQATLAGAIIGTVAGVALITMACCYCRRWHLRQQKIQKLSSVSIYSPPGITSPTTTSTFTSIHRPMHSP